MNNEPNRTDVARERLAHLQAEFAQRRQVSQLIEEPPQARWRLSSIQVKVVVAVIASFTVLAWAWNSMGSKTVMEPQSAGPVSALPIVVDVAGKVVQPGIVELPIGSRVIDAIEAAGGTKAGVDTSGLNLARVLVDGEQIIVGQKVAKGDGNSVDPLSLNTATTEQLEDLPGIGPVTAAAITSWRDANGGFRKIDDLLQVKGIGRKTLAELKPHVSL